MIFDEYVDVINQIENIDKKVNQEIKLLIHLLELENAQVDIQQIDREEVIYLMNSNNPFKKYTNNLAQTLLDNAGYSILALKYLKEHNLKP